MREVTVRATIESTIIKSECSGYRFALSRIWGQEAAGAFLCANPSKADELRYDQTIFKCQNMAANWGWGGFHILNLYPNYSTDPKALVRNTDADELNKHHVSQLIDAVKVVVIACGGGHNARLKEMIWGVSRSKLYCLGHNPSGGFLHPSRIDPDDYRGPIRAFPNEPSQLLKPATDA